MMLAPDKHQQYHQSHVAILMSDLKSSGRVESSLLGLNSDPSAQETTRLDSRSSSTPVVESRNNSKLDQHGIALGEIEKQVSCFNQVVYSIFNGLRYNNLFWMRNQLDSARETETFNTYLLQLRIKLFNRAAILLLLTALAFLIVMLPFDFLKNSIYLINTSQTDEVMKSAQDLRTSHMIILFSCTLQLILVIIVISILNSTKPRRNQIETLQLLLLFCTSAWASILAIQSDLLIAIQPLAMFIIYTLVAVDIHQAFIFNLGANLIHMLSFLFTSSETDDNRPRIIHSLGQLVSY